ncbi:hypothetical protein T07_5757 [Trichinella nelsoni]|uniref:Uncharacterized protein n=1 Tax=Trichinella nelsoni TaxID=6336 RepID=A0A0V0RN01_9BILA|nr:hypothetical protein T07_15280 [Trichinella nelsoni]KRX16133.1 hypothetical protein T07_5757 [Trichinella nelsoni]
MTNRAKTKGAVAVVPFAEVQHCHHVPFESQMSIRNESVIGSANYSDMRETYYRLHNSASPVKITLTA